MNLAQLKQACEVAGGKFRAGTIAVTPSDVRYTEYVLFPSKVEAASPDIKVEVSMVLFHDALPAYVASQLVGKQTDLYNLAKAAYVLNRHPVERFVTYWFDDGMTALVKRGPVFQISSVMLARALWDLPTARGFIASCN